MFEVGLPDDAGVAVGASPVVPGGKAIEPECLAARGGEVVGDDSAKTPNSNHDDVPRSHAGRVACVFGLVRPGAGGTGPSGRKDIVTVPIHLHRSNRVEALVDALGSALAASWPADPFERVPIVVGSRGMERWLRYELATALGVASRLDFPFPRPAFDGAARWILSGGGDARTPFWDPKVYGRTAPAWRGDALCPAIVGPLRRRSWIG